MYIKLINMNYNGNIDYKGLNINKFVASTQLYDFENNIFLCKTNEEVTATEEILIVTEAEYQEYKAYLEEQAEKEREEEIALEERVTAIENSLNILATGEEVINE